MSHRFNLKSRFGLFKKIFTNKPITKDETARIMHLKSKNLDIELSENPMFKNCNNESNYNDAQLKQDGCVVSQSGPKNRKAEVSVIDNYASCTILKLKKKIAKDQNKQTQFLKSHKVRVMDIELQDIKSKSVIKPRNLSLEQMAYQRLKATQTKNVKITRRMNRHLKEPKTST